MRRSKKVKGMFIAVATVLMSLSMESTGLAASKSYSFNLKNTGTGYVLYTGVSNTKIYASNPATVRTNYNNAPGAGFSFLLKCLDPAKPGLASYITATQAGWIKGANIKYLQYLPQRNYTQHDFLIAARIDNDYTGMYSCNGYYNSDYVN